MIARVCDGCGETLPHGPYVELGTRVLRTSEGDNQDAQDQAFGDYCRECLLSGRAVEDLLAAVASPPKSETPDPDRDRNPVESPKDSNGNYIHDSRAVR